MKPVQILLDMDGVVVDFVGGAIKLHGITYSKEEFYKGHLGQFDLVPIIASYKKDPSFTASKFWEHLGYEFWKNLEPTDDYLSILNLLEKKYGQENITICSSPSANVGCIDGKRAWIRDYLPSHYFKVYNQMFCAKKWLAANPNTILVDDADKNCNEFFENGGHSVIVPRLWNFQYLNSYSVLEVIQRQLEAIDTKIVERLKTIQGVKNVF